MGDNILVLLETSQNKVEKSSLCAISAANAIKEKWNKGQIIGVCLGEDVEQLANSYAKYGLDKVVFCSNEEFKYYRAVPYSATLAKIAQDNSVQIILSASTTTGKDCMPRLAGILDVAMGSDVLSFEDEEGVVKRPMYAGNVIAKTKLKTSVMVFTIRATAFSPVAEGASSSNIESIELADFNKDIAGEVVNIEESGGDRPDLTSADIVVSGGRGVQSKEGFEKYIFPLADALGAAIGASRAAVDSGFAPNDWQVGQTGKIVAPNLYIAVGISGAIQHIAGMKDSKVIVAINKDPDAPIFEIADYGLVADLTEAVPKLIEEIKKTK